MYAHMNKVKIKKKKKKKERQSRDGHTPVILATQEVEIRRIAV
jgi:hypothetical protein